MNAAWIPVISALIGGVTGVAGGLAAQLLTSRREKTSYRRARRDKLRDIRAQLYLDMMEYTQDLSAQLEIMSAPATKQRAEMTLLHEDHLRARIALYLGDADPTAAAWDRLQQIFASILHSWWQVDETLNYDPETEDRWFRPDASAVTVTRDSIDVMKGLLYLKLQQEYWNEAKE